MREAPTESPFEPWPWTLDAQGDERKVGVEIELGALDVDTVARTLVDVLGGRVEPLGHQEVRVVDSRLGSLRVELDSRFLKQRKHREFLENLGLEAGAEVVEVIDEIVLRAGTAIVPCEIVTGPLRLEDLPVLEDICSALHLQGAEGTTAEPWYAFGVHFNPSLPAETPQLLYAFLQAFCLLEDWIREDGRVDFSRKISPFVDSFPESYRDVVLQPGPTPARSALIETYLEHNPTRNRGLDMLPAFAYLDPELVKRFIDDEKVKARPTFHYRLGDCRIDDPHWRIAHEWSAWIAVERLAADDDRRLDLIERGVLAEGPL